MVSVTMPVIEVAVPPGRIANRQAAKKMRERFGLRMISSQDHSDCDYDPSSVLAGFIVAQDTHRRASVVMAQTE
jgi:hypothetical protein